jgi:hypothetical protein
VQSRGRPGHTTVPDLIGMDVPRARQVCHELELVLVGPHPDGPPLGALTWDCRTVVTAQSPGAGTAAMWGDAVTVRFRREDGGSGSREPRRPHPGSGQLRAACDRWG